MLLSACECKRLADRLNEEPVAPAGHTDEAPVIGMPSTIDDATAAYVADMREPFELLRQAEAQIAGLMVLATVSGEAIAAHPMLDLAAQAAKQAEDGIHVTRVPARARHHHSHVLQALHDIRRAIAAARRCLLRRDEAAIDTVIGPLRVAHQNLLWATGALPGFEIVALSQSCCAQHATMPPAA